MKLSLPVITYRRYGFLVSKIILVVGKSYFLSIADKPLLFAYHNELQLVGCNEFIFTCLFCKEEYEKYFKHWQVSKNSTYLNF